MYVVSIVPDFPAYRVDNLHVRGKAVGVIWNEGNAMNIARYLISTTVACCLAGCVTPPVRTPFHPANSGEMSVDTRHVVEHNYKLGVNQSAYVGQAMIRVKDYVIETRSDNQTFQSSEPIVAGRMLAHETAPKGSEFKILGTIEYRGARKYVLQFPGGRFDKSCMIVGEDGTYNGFAYNFPMGMVYEASDPTGINFTPASTTFDRKPSETVSKTAGYINFEVVYSGISNDTINLLYREYTPEDMARPAFTQNVSYNMGTQPIRFRDIVMNVDEATNDHIRFTVTAD
jgi:hypothetical protein